MTVLNANKLEPAPKKKVAGRRARDGSPSVAGLEPAGGTGNVRRPGRLVVALSLLLGAFTLALFSPAGGYPFANYDDPAYVTENPHVRAGLSWRTLVWAFESTEASNWHPVTWLSHAADYSLYGANASGHHWTSILIHSLNVVLLFLLLRYATGAAWQSVTVAALFAVHPLNVESVAWISERKNVLSTFFLLLAVGTYGWYARRPRVGRYLAVVVLFAVGLMTKPILVTLPLALLLIDYWPLERFGSHGSEPARFQPASFSRLVVEKLPLLAMSAASVAVTMIAQRASLAPTEWFPLALRLENAVFSCGMYLAKTAWPVSLALYYPHPGAGLPAWQWIGMGVFLVAISVIVWNRSTPRPFLLVGWCWFLGTLVPVLGIVQVGAQAMADRYAYIPLIGIFVAVVWVAWEPGGKVIRAASIAIVLIAMTLLTVRQLGYWKSNYDLWSHTLAVTQNNLVAEDKLGLALQAMGRQDEAVIHFANAARIDSLDPLSNFSLGADLQWHGHLREAIPHYETAIEHTSDPRLQADTYQNLGTDYLQLGDERMARENFLSALRANPGLITVFAGLGELAGEPARSLSQSVLQNPSAEGFGQLASAFQRSGRMEEAGLAYALANGGSGVFPEGQMGATVSREVSTK